ncbi:hypothetical protein SAMN04489724_0656 [Algoriphagus locisalis]|uniref:Uncharacterized protein n=1 Tax=Algoriphagus locisalis TaxID=305507 RepID=A0A1I6XTY9_9BACT|nr:hypothetical protein [Algoriphagus locisalis]SFT41536.1 hypothetical protein SAMN04489724_0656 [Algoriphagus locisalis]
MKKFITKILGFGFLILLLFLTTLAATEIETIADLLPNKISLKKGTTSHQWTRQGEADSTQNIDVLIVGSSLAQSIDIRRFQKFKLRAFNLASGSQSPIQTRYLFDRYLDSFNPKLVIWDVHPYVFANRGVESTVDLIINCHDCGGMISMLFQTKSDLAWNTYIKRMMLKPFEDQEFTFPRESEISKYYFGGFMEVYVDAPESPATIDSFGYEGLQVQKEIFESELKELKKRSIPVLLVYSPKSDGFIQNFQNQQEWFDYYESIVNQGLAEDFLNFNEIFAGQQISAANFYDIAHLTHEGAEGYNKVLIPSLSARLEELKQSD